MAAAHLEADSEARVVSVPSTARDAREPNLIELQPRLNIVRLTKVGGRSARPRERGAKRFRPTARAVSKVVGRGAEPDDTKG